LRKRAFTLIELSVAIVVIGLLAAIIAPNVIAMRRGQDARLALLRVRDLARDGATFAARERTTLELRYDSGSRTLQVVRPADPNATDTGRQEENTLRSFTLPPGAELGAIRVGGDDVSAAGTGLKFYSDGRADAGTIEIEEAGATFTIRVRADGEAELIEGNAEAEVATSWPAGEYEKRQ